LCSPLVEVFNHFKDEQGNFRAWIHDDLKGMLFLYEASYFLVEGESILEDARDFTTKNLEKYFKKCNPSEYLSKMVSHALELPLAWRMLRLESNWFINVYETKTDMEPVLLELAKLDFNMVQALHQEDLKHSSRYVELIRFFIYLFCTIWKQIKQHIKINIISLNCM
jgi:hypothetical protein